MDRTKLQELSRLPDFVHMDSLLGAASFETGEG